MATRTIETNIILGGEREFNAEMKKINSNLGVMKSDMAAVTAQFAENSDSIVALTSKQKLLDASAEQQTEKARLLKERYDAVSKAYGENSAQADKAKIAWNNATVASAKATAEAKKSAEALEKARNGTNTFNEEIGKFDSNLNLLKSELEAVTAKYASNADSVVALTSKQKLLDASAEQQAEKARLLKERYDAVAHAYGEASDKAKEAKIAWNNATVASAKATAEATKNAEALEKARNGTNTFNEEIGKFDSNLNLLKSELEAVTAKYASNADSVVALTSKQKLLDASAEQQAEKARLLKERYDAVAHAYGEASDKAKEAKIAWNNATVASAKATAEAKKNAEALEKARKEASQYTSVGNRMQKAFDDNRSKLKKFADTLLQAARNTPVLAEALEAAEFSVKGLKAAAEKASPAIEGIGTAAVGIGKGLGSITGICAAGVAALGALGVAAAVNMASFAKEAAEAARTAQEAGETLTETQQQWLAFSDQLSSLDASVADAKSALGGVLLPMLSELSAEGGALLDAFSREMEAAAGDTKKQGQIMGRYLSEGASQILAKLPQYIETGKALLSGLGEGLQEQGPELLDYAGSLIEDMLLSIFERAPAMGESGIELINRLIASLTECGPDILTSAVGMVTQLVSGLAKAAPQLVPAAGKLIMQLLSSLLAAAPDLAKAGLELILGLITGIVNSIPDLMKSAGEIIASLVDAFAEKGEEFLSLGADIVEAIWAGIAAAWDGLVSWFNGIWESLFGSRDANVNVNYSSTGDVPGHATGLSYVPYDNYIARLHEGEMVLTRSQANLFRQGQQQAMVTGAPGGGQRTVNLYFSAKTITESEINMVVDIVNRKLGEDL